MPFTRIRQYSVRYVIAQATAHKHQGHYAAAKGLIREYLHHHPQHGELHALFKRLELLQQVKINRRHKLMIKEQQQLTT